MGRGRAAVSVVDAALPPEACADRSPMQVHGVETRLNSGVFVEGDIGHGIRNARCRSRKGSMTFDSFVSHVWPAFL